MVKICERSKSLINHGVENFTQFFSEVSTCMCLANTICDFKVMLNGSIGNSIVMLRHKPLGYSVNVFLFIKKTCPVLLIKCNWYMYFQLLFFNAIFTF